MTERLYYTDSYRKEFSANTISCTIKDGNTLAVLDKTAFYPTTGGQQHDTGSLNGSRVIDVIDNGDTITHVVEGELKTGPVSGIIDFSRRFDFMQQHSGQHLLTQALIRLFGYDTLSSTLNETGSVIEMSAPSITAEKIEEAEWEVNRLIRTNIPIFAYFVSQEELNTLPVRKRPNIEGKIRIVDIEGFDVSCCGGTHCSSTGEINLVKIGKWEKIRGHARISFLCGNRALKDYQRKAAINHSAEKIMSCGEDEIINNARRLIQQNKDLAKTLQKARERYIELHAETLRAGGIKKKDINIVKMTLEIESPGELSLYARRLVSAPDTVAFLGGLLSEEKVSVVFACSDNIQMNMGELLKSTVHSIGGKGGGQPKYAQGGGNIPSGLDEMLNEALNNFV